MGDSEQREEISYTPEELEEIQRIIGVVTSVDRKPERKEAPPASPASAAVDLHEEGDVPDVNVGEPEDLDLPVDTLDELVFEDSETPAEEYYDGDELPDIPLDDLMSGTESVDALGEETGEEEEGLEEFGQSEFEEPFEDEEITPFPDSSSEAEDITDLIREVEVPDEEIEDITADLTEEPSPEDQGSPLSPLEELDELTSEEPESLDIEELADDEFAGMPEEEILPAESPDEGVPDLGLDDLSEEIGQPSSLTVEGAEEDIPDLTDMSFEETADIPEAEELGLPDIDLGETGGPLEDGPESITDEIDEIEDIDIGPVIEEEPSPQEESGELDIEPLEDMPVSSGVPDMEEDLTIEPLDEAEPAEREEPQEEAGEEAVELSDKELKKLKKALILFNPGLRNVIKETVINDLLPADEVRILVDMIISGRSEPQIKDYLEEQLDREIPFGPEAGSSGRRVIHSRPEYTQEGRDRQKRLLKLTRMFGLAALTACIITILSYQYIYKPVMAKKKIDEGSALILRSGDYEAKPKDYSSAEELARYVDQNYREKYLYGYNTYGMSYLKRKEYARAYKKLNTAYKIDPQDVDTLLNLGNYYAKIPARFYSRVQSDVEENYYPKEDRKGRKMSQLDLSINFFKRVLLLDGENLKAMRGIGNAYFSQGQYLKAKKYYQDILKVDGKSVEGYAGLLNLYIERDAYDLVASTHTEVRYKKMTTDLPSPLLAKLANYYLMKKKSDSFNVRVDHTVQSSRLRDADDNTLPAVRSVLAALNAKDSEYPPLMLMEAKLNRLLNNLKVTERYLDRALDRAPDYFGALHLMGKLYYETNQPVKAYEYLDKAVKAYGNQPDFTAEDFYKETENIGETYAIIGDIFYYFFDKVRYRYGSLEDEILDEKMEKMVNYNVAREKYEQALNEGYSSSETHYNLGRIYYLNRQYPRALEQWLHLYDDFVDNPELMFALGNAFYHMGNYDASKGEYLKLISVSEYEADNIRTADKSKKGHVRLFRSLASAYNNLGAVYQLQNDESKSSISYWKGIDYAKRIGVENEFARVNLARSLNRTRKSEPILDENVPYSIKYYREDMRD